MTSSDSVQKNETFLSVVADVLGTDERWPKPLHLLRGAQLVDGGASVREAARSVGTNESSLNPVVSADDRLSKVLGIGWSEVPEKKYLGAARQLGQMVLGHLAEVAFEELYRAQMPGQEFTLEDTREDRSDTDYRVLNGQRRKIYRVNIKFFGTPFRNAMREVGLPSDDCFALGTYKIHQGLQKQEAERLPYVFVIVGVAGLKGETVGLRLPFEYVQATALIRESRRSTQKKDFEDSVVQAAIRHGFDVTHEVLEQLRSAKWYALSARRAERLMRDMLWDRVFALRVKRFAQNYRNAELDMHFSLSGDLTPLEVFLEVLRTEGQTKMATLLERGEY